MRLACFWGLRRERSGFGAWWLAVALVALASGCGEGFSSSGDADGGTGGATGGSNANVSSGGDVTDGADASIGGGGGETSSGGTSSNGGDSAGDMSSGGGTGGEPATGGTGGTPSTGGVGGTGGTASGGGGMGGAGPTCDCAGHTPICDDTQTCVACSSDDECRELSAAAPVCAGGGDCVVCTTNAHCSGRTPVCENNQCRGCQDAMDCPSRACDVATGECRAEENAVYVLAETGLGGECGTRAAPCRSFDLATPQLSTNRNVLVMLPTGASFITGATLPPISNLEVFGNGVVISPYNGTDAISVSGGSATLHDLALKGESNQGAGVSCTAGSITIDQGSTIEGYASGVDSLDCELSVTDSTVRFNDVGIYHPGERSFDLERSRIESNVVAINTQGNPVMIQNNLFLRNGDNNYTRVIHLLGQNMFFGYNTLAGNFNNCIYIGIVVCTGEPVVTSNVSWGNFPDWNGEGDDCLSQVWYCGTVNNSISERLVPGLDNLSQDPMFVNPAQDDYRLQEGSPAIGKGDADFAPSVDYRGAPRPQGDAPDMGAFEYVP